MYSEMSYKQISKNHWEIIAKFRVLKSVFVQKRSKIDTAKFYGMHRNSVSLICSTYLRIKTPESDQLLYSIHPNYDDIERIFSFLQHGSRRPHTLRGIAPPDIEAIILKEHETLKYGYRRLYKHLLNKGALSKNIHEWLVKWIYKRHWMKIRTIRTKNWESKHLYNYNSIAAFEFLHLDVKFILDQWWIPEAIYNKFKCNPALPIYQRTIIDAKSRWRFLAYSHEKNATFWLEFLKLVLMFIRNQWIDRKITIWFDWWSEFCSASEKKLAERNSILHTINCEAYQYEGSRDTRKNLIERSHKSDDEEFYAPRWYFIKDRKSFIKEAKNREMHWNFTRIHTWIGMNTTPYQKLMQCWLPKTFWRDQFPVLILDECIGDIIYHTKTLNIKRFLDTHTLPIDPKLYVDFQVNLNILNNHFAQNVLTQYHCFFYYHFIGV